MGQEKEQKPSTPSDLKEAKELLIQYGRWARDTGRRQRCRSAEGAYASEEAGADAEDNRLPPMMPTWQAMNIQRALAATPERERKVLQAHYVPQRLPIFVLMRQGGFTRRTWNEARIHGMRMFWNIYRLHFQKSSV